MQAVKSKSISIENLTVFKNMETQFCGGINVLIGENGTGKTHLLKLLNIFGVIAGSLEPKDWFSVFMPLLNGTFIPVEITDMNPPLIKINNTVVYDKSLTDKTLKSWPGTAHAHPVFIPAKEMLSISDITRIHELYSHQIWIDLTLTDIIHKANVIRPNKIPKLAKAIAPKLENIMGGTVFVNANDKNFWMQKRSGEQIPFNLEAEGFRKLGLLWQLLMNESIQKDTILFWDEPEANLNPAIIPVLVDILLKLSRFGVQVFVATHDYMFAKYFEIKAEEKDELMFHSLYLTDEGVKCENCINFRDLKNNPIIKSFDALMSEVIG